MYSAEHRVLKLRRQHQAQMNLELFKEDAEKIMDFCLKRQAAEFCLSHRWVWYNTKNLQIFLSYGFNPVSLKNVSFCNVSVYYQVSKWIRSKWLVGVEVASITLIAGENSKTWLEEADLDLFQKCLQTVFKKFDYKGILCNLKIKFALGFPIMEISIWLPFATIAITFLFLLVVTLSCFTSDFSINFRK